ncbi:CDP-glycerol glycerophosphotransferase family protein [Pueribacillus sp. YX66]|uniref:CDP-glycerol glycerophosphotransferase family protein n=1 Tax=Pueribacillus sp. YX66 TaxID=3229242 RepID=UPI0036D2A0E6
MGRELAVSIYLFVFSVFFTFFKWYPQKKKSTFVASFGDNILFTVKELEKRTDEQIVILKTSQCHMNFEEHVHHPILHFELRFPLQWLRSIYHLATSTTVIIDNYYGFLAASDFKSNVRCIQLWHAAGAIKQFGLKDRTIQERSPRALKRFKKVYDRFHYVVVGSNKMASIFRESFGLPDERIVRSGIPRTDFFFDADEMSRVKQSLQETYPMSKEKKVILYAPTYRDNEFTVSSLKLNIQDMYEALREEYVLLLRLHPAVNMNVMNEYPNFVYDVSNYDDSNHLLVITDILVTDYSSIPFEFSLLHKPMVFFAYDLEEYERQRGLWKSYESLVPGPVVKQTDELIEVILENNFDLKKVVEFAKEWNEFSTGNASQRFVDTFYTSVEHDE